MLFYFANPVGEVLWRKDPSNARKCPQVPASATRALDVDLRALDVDLRAFGVDSCDVHSNLASLECLSNSKIYHRLLIYNLLFLLNAG